MTAPIQQDPLVEAIREFQRVNGRLPSDEEAGRMLRILSEPAPPVRALKKEEKPLVLREPGLEPVQQPGGIPGVERVPEALTLPNIPEAIRSVLAAGKTQATPEQEFAATFAPVTTGVPVS